MIGPFSLAERDRRWATVRDLMAARQLDALVAFADWVPGDAYYLANQAGAVVLPLDGPPTLIAAAAAAADAWIGDVRAAVHPGAAAADRLAELKLGKAARIGVAGLSGNARVNVRHHDGLAPYTSVMALRRSLTVLDATDVMATVRARKSVEEIEAIRAAALIAEAALPALAEDARPGQAQAEVYARLAYHLLRGGSEQVHIGWSSGPWDGPPRRWTSPPPGTIASGWLLNNEIVASARRYSAQVCQPVFMGTPPTLIRDLFDLSKLAFERSRKAIVPGRTWVDVEHEVKACAQGTGFEIEMLVNGRGLCQYTSIAMGGEGPLITPAVNRADIQDDVVQAGSVFVLKPFAKQPGDTRELVVWGDTVAVTTSGVERLGRRPYELISIA